MPTMPNLRSGKDTSQSAESLSEDLLECCRSEMLSEEALREIIQRYGLTSDVNRLAVGDYKFFQWACSNERVTEGIIRYVLEYFPDAAHVVDDYGMTTLHFACFNPNVTLDIIRLLIDAAPASVSRVTNANDEAMPLHYLCMNEKVDEGNAVQILKLLIEKYPEAVRHADSDGDLPIHIASATRSLEFCRVLIDVAPDSLHSASNNSWMPLHLLCNNSKLDEATERQKLKLLIESYPAAARHADTQGDLPIHLACYASKSPGFCRVLIDAASDSVRSVNNEGLTPLHVVCGNREVDETAARRKLNFLIEKYPEAAQCADNDGHLPIHLACLSKSLEFCQEVIDAAPDSLRSVNNRGQMPLHIFCEKGEIDEGTSRQILKMLIEKYPDAVRHASNNGSLPIHCAALTKSPEFCRVLIDAYPGSERLTIDGILPLHFACWNGTLSTVEYLYELYQDAINTCTRGHCPLHSAIKGTIHRDIPATAVEIVKFLLDCDRIVKMKSSLGMHLLRFACSLTYTESNIEAALQIIKIIYGARPESIEESWIASDIHNFHQQVQAFINNELVYAHQAKDLRLMITPDVNGRLPLHNSLQNNITLGSVKLLVKGNPQVVQFPDSKGALPLHVACEHHDSTNIILYLVELDTASLDAVDRERNTALHYACHAAKYDTIAMMLQKYDAVSVSKQNDQEKLPIDLLWESNEVSDRESLEYVDSVFQLVRAYPEMIAISNNLTVPVDADVTSNGKKRKFCHDHEE